MPCADVIIQRVQIKKKSRTRMETRRTLPFQVKVEKNEAGKIVQDVGSESGEKGAVGVREAGVSKGG